MPRLTPFDDSNSSYSSSDAYEGYDLFEVHKEKPSFFATSPDSPVFRIYGKDGLHAVATCTPEGSYERHEKLFDIRFRSFQGRYTSRQELEVRPVGDKKLMLQGLGVDDKSLVVVRGLDFVQAIDNREQAIEGLRNKHVVAARAPIWKDSDRDAGIEAHLYVREDIGDPLRDLLLIATVATPYSTS